MKINICITSIFLFLTSLTANAQQGSMSREVRERIESQRIGFITQQLRLTPEEAARFWPIYNEYKDAIKVMREDFERPDLETLTEEEAGLLIEQHLQKEQRKLELKRTLLTRLRTAVPAKKVLMLQKAENEFNRELLRKVKEHGKP